MLRKSKNTGKGLHRCRRKLSKDHGKLKDKFILVPKKKTLIFEGWTFATLVRMPTPWAVPTPYRSAYLSPGFTSGFSILLMHNLGGSR